MTVIRLLAVLLLCGITTAGYSQEVRFEVPELTVIVSAKSLHVQEQLVQRIRLESSYPFEKLNVQFDEPADALVTELQARTTRQFKTKAYKGWVFETSRAIFAERSGELRLPEIRIDGVTRRIGGTDQSFSTRHPEVVIPVSAPAAELTGEPWLVANQVQIEEEWSRPPDLLRAGQIATRTIHVRADGTTAQHISPLKMATSLGIAVLPGEINRRTEVTNDSVIGHLSQTFEVRVLSDAKTDISPVQIAWFNGETDAATRSAVRAYRIEPLPANVDEITMGIVREAHAERLQSSRHLMWTIVGSCLLIGLMALVLLLFTGARRFLRRSVKRIVDFVFGPLVQLPSIGIEAADGQSTSWRHGNAN